MFRLDTTINEIYFFSRLVNEDFEFLAREITKIFPNERKEVYYIPAIRKRHSRDNKCGFARGKLLDKYKNKLTFLRRAKLIPTTRPSNSVTESSLQDDASGIIVLRILCIEFVAQTSFVCPSLF